MFFLPEKRYKRELIAHACIAVYIDILATTAVAPATAITGLYSCVDTPGGSSLNARLNLDLRQSGIPRFRGDCFAKTARRDIKGWGGGTGGRLLRKNRSQ